jgi:hypothetical protein
MGTGTWVWVPVFMTIESFLRQVAFAFRWYEWSLCDHAPEVEKST